MRFNSAALVASAMVLGACGGGEQKPADNAAPAPAAAAPAAAAPAAAAGTAAPITGKTIEVKMIGDAKGYRFEPANITAKVGDGIKFISVAMGPHNVAFTVYPPESKAQLDANFGTDKMGELSSGLKMDNDTFLLSLGGLKPGKYEFNCTPHLAMNMKGTLTITP